MQRSKFSLPVTATNATSWIRSRTSSQSTYVLHLKRRITASVVAIAHHAVFHTVIHAPASRRPNPQASARGYANAVYSQNMQPSLPTTVDSTFYEQTSA